MLHQFKQNGIIRLQINAINNIVVHNNNVDDNDYGNADDDDNNDDYKKYYYENNTLSHNHTNEWRHDSHLRLSINKELQI